MVTSILSWYQNDSFRKCDLKLDIWIYPPASIYIEHVFNASMVIHPTYEIETIA